MQGNLLLALFVLLAASVILVPLAKRLGLGTTLGYLAAGVLIGPYGLRFISDSDTVRAVAELPEVEVDEGDPGLPAARGRQHLTCRAGMVGNGHPAYVVPLERERQLQGLGEQRVVLEDQDAHPAPRRGRVHRHHGRHPRAGGTPPRSRLVLEPFMQLTPVAAPCRR